MAFATADADGHPDVRMVLLKHFDHYGFVFYTNFESAKGNAAGGNPHAAICFHWKSLRRQVRVSGPAVAVSDIEADAYFASRPKDSQIGAWASRQSRKLEGRFALEKEIARYAARFALSAVPRPEYWSGYRIIPCPSNSGVIGRSGCTNGPATGAKPYRDLDGRTSVSLSGSRTFFCPRHAQLFAPHFAWNFGNGAFGKVTKMEWSKAHADQARDFQPKMLHQFFDLPILALLQTTVAQA